MSQHLYVGYIHKVAGYCFDHFGDDLYEALNIAESITLSENNVKEDALRVHAILEEEL